MDSKTLSLTTDAQINEQLLEALQQEINTLIMNHNLNPLLQKYPIFNNQAIKIQCLINIENNNDSAIAQEIPSEFSDSLQKEQDCCRCYKLIDGILYYVCCSPSPCS